MKNNEFQSRQKVMKNNENAEVLLWVLFWRKKQIKFNKDNNITPVGIIKKVKDIIETLEDVEEHKKERALKKENRKYEDLTEPEMIKEITKLEKAMQTSARNLEFEKAASIRDQVKYLKEQIYGANIKDKI